MCFFKKEIMKIFYKLLSFLMIIIITGCAGTKPDIIIPTKMPPKLMLSQAPKVALVLGSGGARGYANAGVIDALRKNNIKINLLIGTSAGSIIGALYADNGSISQTKKALMSAGFFDFADLNNIPKLNSVISGYHLQKFLLHNMRSREFKDLKIPLIVIATNISNGKQVEISSGPIAPAVNASSAIPGILEPVKLYGKTLVDGGTVDPIAVDVAKKYGAKIIIAVDVNRKLSKAIPITSIGMAKRAINISLNRLANFTSRDADIVIHPVLNEGTFDISDKHAIYNAGYNAGVKEIPRIKKVLNRKTGLTGISDSIISQ
jgi:NTE family protein